MTFVMIGAGNVATSLVPALQKAGHEVVQVYSRTLASAKRLADTAGCQATDNINKVSPDADVYLFCLKDDVIAEVADQLQKVDKSALFIHTSGSVDIDVLMSDGRCCGVIYPMQTFSRERIVDMTHVPCFTEASDEDTMRTVTALAQSITDNVMPLSSEGRRWLHIAAVFACNFSNHCYALAQRALEAQGLPFSLMLPLIDETTRKAHTMAPRDAQTGPAVRHDTRVTDRHIEMLASQPELQRIYKLMTQSIERL
ncbi:MAG: DUF2520 domain-containing protein [Prevotella sp.]|nr:DUF2520 domain-containing protein [Prevotella sp.]